MEFISKLVKKGLSWYKQLESIFRSSFPTCSSTTDIGYPGVWFSTIYSDVCFCTIYSDAVCFCTIYSDICFCIRCMSPESSIKDWIDPQFFWMLQLNWHHAFMISHCPSSLQRPELPSLVLGDLSLYIWVWPESDTPWLWLDSDTPWVWLDSDTPWVCPESDTPCNVWDCRLSSCVLNWTPSTPPRRNLSSPLMFGVLSPSHREGACMIEPSQLHSK